jgi:squalene synthase HpnC
VRTRLEAIYAYARFVDDLGDRYSGDRLDALSWARSELDRAFLGEPTDRIFSDVVEIVTSTGIGRQPLDDLISANVVDQRKSRYATFGELEEYCALSAAPVGRLVLAIFDAYDERSVALSDAVCAGLQLVEHLQDLGEDARDGRVYFPECDLSTFDVTIDDLLAATASSGVRRLVAFESARARRLLVEGAPLASRLRGVRRAAIAGFIGGGIAQLDAIARANFDVLSSLVKAPTPSVIWRAGSIALRPARAVR